jgi:hypothetical protein
MNATEFGHMDVCGPLAAELCPTAKNASTLPSYRATAAGAIAAFARGLIPQGGGAGPAMAAAAAAMDGTVKAPIGVLYSQQLQGLSPSEVRASCTSTPE